jgi:hypothetical protein
MTGSSLPPVVSLRLVYPMLPVSPDCQCLIATSVFSNIYIHIRCWLKSQVHLNFYSINKAYVMPAISLWPFYSPCILFISLFFFQNSDVFKYFAIDFSSTGIVTVKQPTDFDDLRRKGLPTYFILNLTAEVNYNASAKVVVHDL